MTSSAFTQVRSAVGGIEWPPISTGRAAILAAFLRQLEDTQWLPSGDIVRLQLDQLTRVANHCAKHSKQFRARLARAKLKPDDLGAPGGLAKLPVLTRRDLQIPRSDLYCGRVPADHLPMGETRTSGSTGEPVVVQRTEVTQLIWQSMTMRDHLWHKRDFGGRMALVRAGIKTQETHDDWGAPASLLFHTGRAIGIPLRIDARDMAEILSKFQPDNLLIYPSALDALTHHCEAHNLRLPGLRHIRSVSETLSLRVREAAVAYFGAKVEDSYTSQELGSIALQCPESGLYHVMAESVIVEVLDNRGQPCREGEFGRVIVTDLHNFATPLIRYEIGDYAEVGGACSCGRGLPTLKRILGRERNLILMPDGRRFPPGSGLRGSRDVAPVSQYQLVQTERETIEVRLVTERPITVDEEAKLRNILLDALGYPFALQLKFFTNRLAPDATGKFEEFVCRANPS
jgi:phenylacetate-CoA ligase